MRRTKNFPTFAAAAALAAVSLTVAMPAEAQSRRAPTAEAPASLTPRAAPAVQRPVTFASAPGQPSGALVLPLGAEADLAVRGAALTPAAREAVTAALSAARFDYKARQTLSLHGVGGWDRILVVGLPAEAKAADVQTAGIVSGRALIAQPGEMTVLTAGLSADSAAELATGLGLGQYRSDLHRTPGRDAAAPGAIALVAADAVQAQGLARLVVEAGGGQGGGDGLVHGRRQGCAARRQIGLGAQRQDQGARGLTGRGGEGHGALHGGGGARRQGGRFRRGGTAGLRGGRHGDGQADSGQSGSGGEGREFRGAAHRSEPPRCR